MSEQLARVETLAEQKVEPLCDPYAIGIGSMLDNPPVERRWLLNELMPLGVVGLLAAGGGTGKSFLTLQLSIAIATGRPFLGIEVGEPGGVLVLAAEDEQEELHRRFWRVVERMKEDGDLDDMAIELLRERLFIASRVGQDNRLTSEVERVLIRTAVGDRICALVDHLPTIKLIVLDPVSRFRGGDENANDAATRFVEVVESIRAKTGATILMPHHVSKDGLRAGADALSVEGLRGASALVDGVRWAAAMATMRKDAAKEYGIDPEDAGRYVRFDAVKNNYASPWPGMWLERSRGGVLIPTNLERCREARTKERHEERYQMVLPKVVDLVRQGQELGDLLSPNKVLQRAGVDGPLGVGESAVRVVLDRAIREGRISQKRAEKGRGHVLRTYM